MSVARSYARALYEAAIQQKSTAQQLDALESQLDQLVGLIQNSKELKMALVSPATPPKEKVAVVTELTKAAGFSALASNFLVLMARKQRLGILPEVREALSVVRLESEGGIQGRLISADPLSSADLDTLSRAFSQKLGKKVAFRTATDPNLLAGMKVTVNGITYDGTLRSQLRMLRDQLVYGTGSTH